MSRPEAPSTSLATLPSLDVGVLQRLLQPVGHPRLVLQQRGARPRQIAQFLAADARAQNSPSRARSSRGASHWLSFTSVLRPGNCSTSWALTKRSFELAPQQIPDRLPVHARRFHRRDGHLLAHQPVAQFQEPRRGCAERALDRPARPAASIRRTQATTESLCTSMPQQHRCNTSMASIDASFVRPSRNRRTPDLNNLLRGL